MAQKFTSPAVLLGAAGWDGIPEPSPQAVPPAPVKLPPGPLVTRDPQQQVMLVTGTDEPQIFNGMALPFAGTVLSTFGPKRDEDVIRSSIEMILLTQPRERVMFPVFGSDLSALLFEPSDEILAIALRAAVEEAVQAWEPRVEIGTVDITPGDTTINVKIPMVIPKPDGPREINFDVELTRETLHNIPRVA